MTTSQRRQLFPGKEAEVICLLKILDCRCSITSFFLRNNLSSEFLSDRSSLASFSNVTASIAFRTSKLFAFLFDSSLDDGLSLLDFMFQPGCSLYGTRNVTAFLQKILLTKALAVAGR